MFIPDKFKYKQHLNANKSRHLEAKHKNHFKFMEQFFGKAEKIS
jgi:hypothetical protein